MNYSGCVGSRFIMCGHLFHLLREFRAISFLNQESSVSDRFLQDSRQVNFECRVGRFIRMPG